MSRKTVALAETMSESYNSEHLFSGKPVERIEVTGELAAILDARIAAGEAGAISKRSFWQIVHETLAKDHK